MADNNFLPPRISTTPPPMDSSFDENSNNSKSTEEFNHFNLYDSDIIDGNKDISINDTSFKKDIESDCEVDEKKIIENEKPQEQNELFKDRSDTLKNEEELKNDSLSSQSDTLKSEDLFPINEQLKSEIISNNEESSLFDNWTSNVNDAVEIRDEDTFNLSDDKLNTIIENFHISTSDKIVESIKNEDNKQFVDINWNPFGESKEENVENLNDDWAAFDNNYNSASNTNDNSLNSNLFNEFLVDNPFSIKSEIINEEIKSENVFSNLESTANIENVNKIENVEHQKDNVENVVESNIKEVAGGSDDDFDDFLSNDNVIEISQQEPDNLSDINQSLSSIDNIELNDKIFYENTMKEVNTLLEKIFLSSPEIEFTEDVDIDEDYYLKNDEVNDLYDRLCDFKNSETLKFTWRNSFLEDEYLKSINIDKRKINVIPKLSDTKNRYTTIFSSDQMDNILKPVKVETNILPTTESSENINSECNEEKKLENIDNKLDIETEKSTQPQLATTTTTTTTTTDNVNTTISTNQGPTGITSFDLDLDLSYLESKTTTSTTNQQQTLLLNELLNDIYLNKTETETSAVTISTPSPSAVSNELILTPQFNLMQPNQQQQQQQQQQQIKTIIKTNIDPNNKLSQKAIDLLDKLPNLNFMKSKVLMFPLSNSTNK